MPTVLYGEDDKEHRIMMRFYLRNTDITLLEASNGQEVLQKIQEHRPDLILLDLFMPKLDGYGVMQALKANPDTKDIPIIVISAWPTGINRKRAQEAGAVDFIIKPYDPFRLVKIIEDKLADEAES